MNKFRQDRKLVNTNLRNIVAKLHLWLGLTAGAIIFVVCLTGGLYTFRAQIENALNYKNIFVEVENGALSLDSIRAEFRKKQLTINQFIIPGKPNRSLEVYYTSDDGENSGMYYLNPYSGKIIGDRNTALSPFFEVVLSLHKNLLMSETGKQIVGASVIVFVFMLLSGFVLWMPQKLKNLGRKLRLKRSEGKLRFLLDLHQVSGFYSLLLLLMIAVMGLYIAYPWVKSSLIVAFGGNPVLSEASEKQSEKIKHELAASFAESLAKIMEQKNEAPAAGEYSVDAIFVKSNEILPYKSITTIQLPSGENSWISVKKINRENLLRAILTDELEFNRNGEIKNMKLFKDKSTDQKFVALSLPLHTGEILGWPSLILYFFVTLIGASLPLSGTLLWWKRMQGKKAFASRNDLKANFYPKFANRFKSKSSGKNELLILYGSKSGNSKLVARQAQHYLNKNGVNALCKNMSAYRAENLANVKNLLVVVSTHGEGDPPPSARRFFKTVLAEKMPGLAHLNYSVCALGDSSYSEFCLAGKTIDRRFTQLGATSFYPRKDCDLEFAEDAIDWIKQTTQKLHPAKNANQPEISIPNLSEVKIYQGKISSREVLTGSPEVAPVYHLILDIDSSDFNYKIGDSVEFYPQNPGWLVDEIASRIEAAGAKKQQLPALKNQLLRDFEITSLSQKTLEAYAKLAFNDDLQNLLQSEKELRNYLAKANILDLISDYPSPEAVLILPSILPNIKRRAYSIASSQKAFPNQLHLTIKTIRFSFNATKHEGAASVFANEFLEINSTIEFRLIPNETFCLPRDKNVPVIMIGVSTGIAPFRAILQEREVLNAKGKTWLMWGNKYRDKDFLYAEDLKNFKANGTLEKLDTAFSCEGETKCYVHDLIVENSAEFISWVETGAHIYVCGSLKMAASVKQSIEILLVGNTTGQTFDLLLEQQRYHEDAY